MPDHEKLTQPLEGQQLQLELQNPSDEIQPHATPTPEGQEAEEPNNLDHVAAIRAKNGYPDRSTTNDTPADARIFDRNRQVITGAISGRVSTKPRRRY
jgi:hypothetical protein